MIKYSINISFLIVCFFFLVNCSSKNNTEDSYLLELDDLLHHDTATIDSLRTMNKWLVSKTKVSINDITEEFTSRINKQDWQLTLNQIEKYNLAIYQCNILSTIYSEIIQNYGFKSHILHMSDNLKLCGHAITAIELNKDNYFIMDTWGQQEFLNKDSIVLSYFDFLELVVSSKFEDITIKTNTFKTKGKNEELVSQNYYSIANDWIEICQEFKGDKPYLDVYTDIAYIQLSYPDTFFYKKVLEILDTNYISNDYFDVAFLSTQ